MIELELSDGTLTTIGPDEVPASLYEIMALLSKFPGAGGAGFVIQPALLRLGLQVVKDPDLRQLYHEALLRWLNADVNDERGMSIEAAKQEGVAGEFIEWDGLTPIKRIDIERAYPGDGSDASLIVTSIRATLEAIFAEVLPPPPKPTLRERIARFFRGGDGELASHRPAKTEAAQRPAGSSPAPSAEQLASAARAMLLAGGQMYRVLTDVSASGAEEALAIRAWRAAIDNHVAPFDPPRQEHGDE